MAKGKNTLTQKYSWKRNIPCNYRPITCLTAENPDHTDLRRGLLLACMLRTVSGRAERMSQGNKRNGWPKVHCSTHLQGQQSNAEKMKPWQWLITKHLMILSRQLYHRISKMWKISIKVMKFIKEAMKSSINSQRENSWKNATVSSWEIHFHHYCF